jgi:hypothetical protein
LKLKAFLEGRWLLLLLLLWWWPFSSFSESEVPLMNPFLENRDSEEPTWYLPEGP